MLRTLQKRAVQPKIGSRAGWCSPCTTTTSRLCIPGCACLADRSTILSRDQAPLRCYCTLLLKRHVSYSSGVMVTSCTISCKLCTHQKMRYSPNRKNWSRIVQHRCQTIRLTPYRRQPLVFAAADMLDETRGRSTDCCWTLCGMVRQGMEQVKRYRGMHRRPIVLV